MKPRKGVQYLMSSSSPSRTRKLKLDRVEAAKRQEIEAQKSVARLEGRACTAAVQL